MKNKSVLRIVGTSFLGGLIATLYFTKIKSIIASVDITSYILFTSTSLFAMLTVYSKTEFFDFIKSVHDKTLITSYPKHLYEFCKNYYWESEEQYVKYVEENIKDESLKKFCVRFIDKNDRSELEEYLNSTKVLNKKTFNNAKKVVYLNNCILLVGVVMTYIYDTNIKGVLLIASLLAVLNIYMSKNISRNILIKEAVQNLFENIYNDILTFKNAKAIMYKAESLLLLDSSEEIVENYESVTDSKVSVNDITSFIQKEARVSEPIMISKNEESLETINPEKISV